MFNYKHNEMANRGFVLPTVEIVSLALPNTIFFGSSMHRMLPKVHSLNLFDYFDGKSTTIRISDGFPLLTKLQFYGPSLTNSVFDPADLLTGLDNLQELIVFSLREKKLFDNVTLPGKCVIKLKPQEVFKTTHNDTCNKSHVPKGDISASKFKLVEWSCKGIGILINEISVYTLVIFILLNVFTLPVLLVRCFRFIHKYVSTRRIRTV